MGRQRLPENGTQTNFKNVTNKTCIKTAINERLKKINRTINSITEINCLTAVVFRSSVLRKLSRQLQPMSW